MLEKIKKIIILKVPCQDVPFYLYILDILSLVLMITFLLFYFFSGDVSLYNESTLGLFYETLEKKDVIEELQIKKDVNKTEGISIVNIVVTGTLIGLFLICVYTGMSYIAVKYILEVEPQPVATIAPLIESASGNAKNIAEYSVGSIESESLIAPESKVVANLVESPSGNAKGRERYFFKGKILFRPEIVEANNDSMVAPLFESSTDDGKNLKYSTGGYREMKHGSEIPPPRQGFSYLNENGSVNYDSYLKPEGFLSFRSYLEGDGTVRVSTNPMQGLQRPNTFWAEGRYKMAFYDKRFYENVEQWQRGEPQYWAERSVGIKYSLPWYFDVQEDFGMFSSEQRWY